jgi:hypothetical protein
MEILKNKDKFNSEWFNFVVFVVVKEYRLLRDFILIFIYKSWYNFDYLIIGL